MANNVVLITGGTGAIGIALCRQFHSEGITVVANCHPSDITRSTEALAQLNKAGITVELRAFDVTDAAECEKAIRDIESQIGPIDVVVNAAGITRDAKLTKMEPEQWSAVLRTNLDGVYNVSRPVIGPMTTRKFGRIINISSVNGQRGQIGQTNYSAFVKQQSSVQEQMQQLMTNTPLDTMRELMAQNMKSLDSNLNSKGDVGEQDRKE